MTLHLTGKMLAGVSFDDALPADLTLRELQGLQRSIDKYELALDKATLFQQRVWQALRAIPRGETRSYSEIAEMAGHPGAARAVGSACGRNPFLLAIPCHRAVGRNGLGGFALGLGVKQRLLDLEKVV